MVTVTTALDYEIICDKVAQETGYPLIDLYTQNMTALEACQILGNPEHSKALTATKINFDGSIKTQVFEGYTEIFSITQYRSMSENGLQIKLLRPNNEEDF